MQRFDCLSPEFSLIGPHLLEASAGTGKTFAVEQIFVRLLLEGSLEVEQILVITFTRAAARELRERVRSNVEKALAQLVEDSIQWAYLLPFRGEKTALQTLQDALSLFDRSQIFTIHGFCHRMLKEFAFEAKFCVSSARSDEPCVQICEKMEKGAIDFLSSLSKDLVSPEQLSFLLKKYQGTEGLVKALLRVSIQNAKLGVSFDLLYEEYIKMWKPCDISLEQVLDDFHLMSPNYKVAVKGKFEEQIKALYEAPTLKNFDFLLSEEGSLFDFLSPSNRKVKYTPLSLASEPFFAWGMVNIFPLLQRGSNPKQIFAALAYEWSQSAQRLMSQEELFDPDAILQAMHKSLKNPSFLQLVRRKYAAAIIDEFQDTDSSQWDIFRTLFLDEEASVRSVFLVGDPKQSIYRFRKADIYTYLEAKKTLASSCHYCLDTNFRSSPSLLGALNALFTREWLSLPKLGCFLPYQPVRAGLKDAASFSDGKGAIHFLLIEGAAKKGAFEEALEVFLLPFLAKEVLALKGEIRFLSDVAVLVKDRYQAGQVVRYLQEKGLPALTKTHMPLGETFGFEALQELFLALVDPQDRSRAKLVLAGPLFRFQAEEMPDELPVLFFELKAILEERGLAPFFQALFSSRLNGRSVLESIAFENADFYRDFFHGIELLLEWEQAQGFSLEGLSRALHKIRFLETDEDEKARRRLLSDDEAVQVMTMHVSKGLEFDVVFALGLAAQTPKPEEELDELEAEKLRQLYVAMTRAKRRLYVPAFTEIDSLDVKGGASPIEIFLHKLKNGSPLQVALDEIKSRSSLSWEVLQEDVFDSADLKQGPPSFAFPPLGRYEAPISYLHSFTSLSRPLHTEPLAPLSGESATIHTLPRGSETGILLHSLLEDIFSAPNPLWRKKEERRKLVESKLRDTKFSPWTLAIQNALDQVVSLPFLAQLEPEDVRTEVEFIFESSPHFIKGFVDLLFRRGEELYFLDWKSNWLGQDDEAYSYAALEASIKASDYELQASLYAEGLKRAFPEYNLVGAYYLFLRGIGSTTQGIFFLQPRSCHVFLA